jgi:fructosamine-3-kinase
MARMGGIAGKVESLLGTSVVATTAVAGGDVCSAARVKLSDGRNVFVKTLSRAPRDFFATEASGLRWLGQVEPGARVPDVLAHADDCLILTWVESGRPTSEIVEDFARRLAQTHRAGAPTFGAPTDGYVGTAPLSNAASASWPEFFATRRLLPYVRAARDRGALSTDDAAPIEQVVSRIESFAGPAEPPSRIHGDLWSGNIVWSSTGHGVLVDPAAHGGHRETDLAMLSLFGAPHLSRLLEAYHEASPLAAGFRERIPLHQLHPLLVHATLFGGSYGARAAAAARGLLSAREVTS